MTEITQTPNPAPQLTRKDFQNTVDPKWCIGCGCYGTFNALTSVLPVLGIARENFAIISGIGCSSRLPYYANTYGFHTIHGRAPTVAMGLKLANPELSTWIITGDGDALSIGGNHFMHLMRRNPDIKMILFNNQIYGLTKGQTSPTSAYGKTTKSTPFGSVDRPVNPASLAIAAGATFVARAPDTDGELLREVFTAAGRHKGVAFVEVLINCVIFNDGVYEHLTNKETKAETTLRLREGKPLVFGKSSDRAIRMNGIKPEIVKAETADALAAVGASVHDPRNPDPTMAYMLSQLEGPDFPVPMGILRQIEAPVYGEGVARIVESSPQEECARVLRGSSSWTVPAGAAN